MRLAVPKTRELLRIQNLPRRTWEDRSAELVEQVTAHLTKPGHRCPNKRGKPCAELNGVSVVKLRPWQAAGLAEAHDHGGTYVQAGVGDGKTLVSMVAGPMLEADRILLVVPADLVEDTWRKFAVLRQHWKYSPLDVKSYHFLSNIKNKDFLDKYFRGARRPLLVLDEAYFAKNIDGPKPAACAARINDFVEGWREEEYRTGTRTLVVVDMSGTPVNRSVNDCQPLMKWAQPDTCPLPIIKSDLLQWSSALDEKVIEGKYDLGALTCFQDGSDEDREAAVRRGLAKRIFDTPGFIAAPATDVPASLVVELKELALTAEEDAAYEGLRRADMCETPDGWPIADEVDRWRHSRSLHLNLYYVWSPRPPDEWLDKRREFCRGVRDRIANNQSKIYTELQVVHEICETIYGRRCPVCKTKMRELVCEGLEIPDDAPSDENDWGHGLERVPTHEPAETVPAPASRRHPLADAYLTWKEIQPTFVPNVEPRWVGSTALDYCAKWAKEGPGIIWTEHRHFAIELANRTGLAYYANLGLDGGGRPIESADPTKTCIASIESNYKGRNLQAFDRALVTSCPPTGTKVQQLIGRHHRPGTRADVVRVQFLLNCREQLAGFFQAKRDCAWAGDMQQSIPKLALADIVGLEKFRRKGLAWQEPLTGAAKNKQVREAIERLRPE